MTVLIKIKAGEIHAVAIIVLRDLLARQQFSKGRVGYLWQSTRDIYQHIQHIPPIYGLYSGCIGQYSPKGTHVFPWKFGEKVLQKYSKPNVSFIVTLSDKSYGSKDQTSLNKTNPRTA